MRRKERRRRITSQQDCNLQSFLLQAVKSRCLPLEIISKLQFALIFNSHAIIKLFLCCTALHPEDFLKDGFPPVLYRKRLAVLHDVNVRSFRILASFTVEEQRKTCINRKSGNYVIAFPVACNFIASSDRSFSKLSNNVSPISVVLQEPELEQTQVLSFYLYSSFELCSKVYQTLDFNCGDRALYVCKNSFVYSDFSQSCKCDSTLEIHIFKARMAIFKVANWSLDKCPESAQEKFQHSSFFGLGCRWGQLIFQEMLSCRGRHRQEKYFCARKISQLCCICAENCKVVTAMC